MVLRGQNAGLEHHRVGLARPIWAEKDGELYMYVYVYIEYQHEMCSNKASFVSCQPGVATNWILSIF